MSWKFLDNALEFYVSKGGETMVNYFPALRFQNLFCVITLFGFAIIYYGVQLYMDLDLLICSHIIIRDAMYFCLMSPS